MLTVFKTSDCWQEITNWRLSCVFAKRYWSFSTNRLWHSGYPQSVNWASLSDIFLQTHTCPHSANTFPDTQSFLCCTGINADPRSSLQPGPLQPLTDSSDHSWESKSCSGIALQFSGARITWSWTDPEHWSLWNWVRNVWRGLLNELAGYHHPWPGLLQWGRLFDSTGLWLAASLPNASPSRRKSALPKLKVEPMTLSKSTSKFTGFASDQDWAISWGCTRRTHKNKCSFIQQI